MKEDYFDRLLDEWTGGLSFPDNLISIFTHIRDIPYAVMPDQTDPISGPKNLVRNGRGYCNPKHFLLGILFERLGISIRYVSIPYLWDQSGILYPEKLRKIAFSLPLNYHLACRAFIDGRWVLVDATWDPPLAIAGFPVNIHWNGRSDTLPAVSPSPAVPPGSETGSPVSIIIHESTEERLRLYTRMIKSYTSADIAARTEFGRELNQWLDEVRNKYKDNMAKKLSKIDFC